MGMEVDTLGSFMLGLFLLVGDRGGDAAGTAAAMAVVVGISAIGTDRLPSAMAS
jgi:hypothetical protein